MYKTFDSMPDHSRLWVYQANRQFTVGEKQILEEGLKTLCTDWTAHGAPLYTSFTIAYDRFVVIVVDEEVHGASGCSIDSSVHFLHGLQRDLGLDFFDRSQVAFNDGNDIFSHPFNAVKTLLSDRTLSPETLSFNNAVTTKADWETQWLVPVKNSWMARFLPKTPVAG
jgi:hypothetical protein